FAFRSSERAEVANVLSLLGLEPSDEHKAALRGLGNGECIFRDLDDRAGRIGIDLLAPVVILGAIWLAWQGLIRKRATRTNEGTLWMVVACVAAIALIGRPAAVTG